MVSPVKKRGACEGGCCAVETIQEEQKTNEEVLKEKDDEEAMARNKKDILTPSNHHQPPKEAASSMARHFRLLLLLVLAVNSSVLILLARYTRSAPIVPDILNCILVTEIGKVLLNSLLEAWTVPEGGIVSSIRYHIVDRPMDAIQLLLPAVLYLIQNYLMYYSVGNLTAPVYQALLQGRLLTTAAVSIVLLSRSYSIQQWACLFILTVGVTIVILDTEFPNGNTAVTQNSIHGLVALSVSCLSNSLACVYFEYLVKQQQQQRKPTLTVQNTPSQEDATTAIRQPSLWMRSLQLALFTILLIFLERTIGSQSSSSFTQEEPRPFFYGFTPLVWLVIFLAVGGGSLVAAVIKVRRIYPYWSALLFSRAGYGTSPTRQNLTFVVFSATSTSSSSVH
jgi:solute carrier family 35 (UDP-sugar transporter), member A1/2/3